MLKKSRIIIILLNLGFVLYSSESLNYNELILVDDFYIGKYEVTYRLWSEIYTWAKSSGYKFQNVGQKGRGTIEENESRLYELLPVTKISWYDAIVWCNAYSEYNSLEPVYKTVYGTIIRDSSTDNVTQLTYLKPDYSCNGYRLPIEDEWVYAASNRGLTPLSYGAGSSDSISNIEAIEEVGWIESNSQGKAHIVGTRKPNELGLYDMTGNVWEWCVGYSKSKKRRIFPVIKGGSFFYSNNGEWVSIGFSTRRSPSQTYNYFGFRLARTKSLNSRYF